MLTRKPTINWKGNMMINNKVSSSAQANNLIRFDAAIPSRIKNKALYVLLSQEHRIGNGWKKVGCLGNWISYKLNNNYRILREIGGICYVSHHDGYEKRIRNLRRKAG